MSTAVTCDKKWIELRRLCGNRERISLEDEEPLTLEMFGSLLHANMMHHKALIIARVETEGSDKPFYYLAHHLNKILFRKYGQETQYLFRLHSMNPLTNTEIEGNVEYYKISPSKDTTMTSTTSLTSLSNTQKDPETSRESLKKLISQSIGSVKEDMRIMDMSGGPITVKTEGKKISMSLDNLPMGHDLAKVSFLSVPNATASDHHLVLSTDKLDKLKEITKKSKKQRRRPKNANDPKRTSACDPDVVPAVFIGNDDEYMHNQALRSVFQESCINASDIELFDMPEEVLINEGIFPPHFDPSTLNDADFINRLRNSLQDDAFAEEMIAQLMEARAAIDAMPDMLALGANGYAVNDGQDETGPYSNMGSRSNMGVIVVLLFLVAVSLLVCYVQAVITSSFDGQLYGVLSLASFLLGFAILVFLIISGKHHKKKVNVLIRVGDFNA